MTLVSPLDFPFPLLLISSVEFFSDFSSFALTREIPTPFIHLFVIVIGLVILFFPVRLSPALLQTNEISIYLLLIISLR